MFQVSKPKAQKLEGGMLFFFLEPKLEGGMSIFLSGISS